jgi:hypothetical protein
MDCKQLRFNDFIGKEDRNTEFKEFTFYNSGLLIDNQLAESYCISNKFDFNPNVLKNLKRYVRTYLPKYTCAFLNGNIKGKLYIGVNDYGFIKGIPFQGELPIKSIKKMIFDIIKITIRNNMNYDIDFQKLISVDIIKVNNPEVPKKPISKTFTNFIAKKQIFINRYNKFVEKNNRWKNKFNFFTQKLIDLVNNNDSRKMLIEYIRKHEPNNLVIYMLESEYILEYQCHEKVNILKKDSTNPYYWVCKWKDEMINFMKQTKPVFNDNDFTPATPYNLIISANEMIPYWIHNNSCMNLYLITININTLLDIIGTQTSSKIFFSYLQYNDKSWLSCYRDILSDGEPVCTPFI